MPKTSGSAKLRLFVAGLGPNSERAIRNLRSLCATEDDWTFEVIDVHEHPDMALEHNVMLTPTLVRLDCEPNRRMTGSLTDQELVVRTLELDGSGS